MTDATLYVNVRPPVVVTVTLSPGVGAFFHVKDAKPGDKVTVTTTGGRTFTYSVASVKSYPKRDLPADVWSKHGRARLVLVTCGGPFDQKTKHYVDNIVLTAYPA